MLNRALSLIADVAGSSTRAANIRATLAELDRNSQE
jgi:hypothetical protein